VSSASFQYGVPGFTRALPNTETAWMDADEALGRLDDLCHNAEYPPGFACGDLLGHLGQLRLLVGSHRVGKS
jgi:hypothetical protein